MSVEAPRPDDPGKLYYSIREVSELLDVKPHVLRYWESQFRMLRPKKSRAGNRMYRPKDVDLLREIQHLLHVRRYTIAGARQELHRRRRSEPETDDATATFDEPEAASDPEAVSLPDEDWDAVMMQERSVAEAEALELFPKRRAEGGIPEAEEAPATRLTAAAAKTPGASIPPRASKSSDGSTPPGSPITPGKPDALPVVAQRGVPAGELAPLREEIRQLKEWLESGVVGPRNRG